MLDSIWRCLQKINHDFRQTLQELGDLAHAKLGVNRAA
jgi:hypothetical protein